MKLGKTLFVLAALVLVLVLFSNKLYTSLGDLNKDPNKYVGEKINVKGTVTDSIKLGQLMAFTIADNGYELKIKSDMLPAVGQDVWVRGTLVKDTLLGIYLDAERVVNV